LSRSIFVTGTDTEVGKTAVSCALLLAVAREGLSTAAIKPVAAGCDDQGQNDDALALMKHMTVPLEYAQVNPVALPDAMAPHIAAERAGKRLQVGRLAGLCRGVMFGAADFILIEGAGGWRVPLNRQETLADLPRQLDIPVVMVVGMKLGCLNHALLTAEAIRRDGLQLAGWVANQPGQVMDGYAENLETLRQTLGAPLLGEVPHLDPWNAEEASNFINIQPLIAK
jgi:dethiobiotin synthetase